MMEFPTKIIVLDFLFALDYNWNLIDNVFGKEIVFKHYFPYKETGIMKA